MPKQDIVNEFRDEIARPKENKTFLNNEDVGEKNIQKILC